jgi:uncharacterized protein YjbI with pentapeptide repeats
VEAWNQWRADNPNVTPDLSGADLIGAKLTDIDLSDVNLSDANLSDANIMNANLSGADLRSTGFIRTDLNGAVLNGAALSDACLISAVLRGAFVLNADLSGASLSDAVLINTDLSGANLSDVNLHGGNLFGADLTRADLSSAHLNHAHLENADLKEANLNGTILDGTAFGNTNLSGATGLEFCQHDGPSFLDYHTLAKSGHLPLSFLRGCGLSDQFISHLPSLLGEAIEFYSCFISYSTNDQEFAERVYADLQNKGVRCWFAPHDIQGGKKIHEQIDEAIRRYDKLLLILSEHSMECDWVETEISKARKRELGEKRRMLFPVRLVDFETLRDWECFDADAGKDSAREIREYFIPDFSNWKNRDSYQQAFERLLKDLTAEKSDPPIK